MSLPVKPEMLVGDDWMGDASARAEFERGLNVMDEEMKPITDALDASEQLSEEDWAARFNASQSQDHTKVPPKGQKRP